MTALPMKPSARRVLNRLRQGPGTTHDLMQSDVGGGRFGARIGELRDLGFLIAEERLPLPTRGSRYTLTFDAEMPVSARAGLERSREPAATTQGRPLPAAGDGSLFNPDAFAERRGYRDAA